MTYKGTVKNGVVVLPPDADFAEGQVVDIAPACPSPEERFVYDIVSTIAKPRDLPDDLAINHDYYLHSVDHKKEPRQARWIARDDSTAELTDQQAADEANALATMAAETSGLPADLSTNHDHYLHGLAKR